jgi:single-strand DNA-binding protein
MDYSKITLVGRVQPRDAETRFTPDGREVLSFRFVVGRRRKDRLSGELIEESDWYQVSCFGNLAKVMAERAVKGARLMVDGRFSSRLWSDNEQREHTSLEVLANDIIDLSPARTAPTVAEAHMQTTDEEVSLNDLPF